MSIVQSDHLISRCPHCGSWMWRHVCKACWLMQHDTKEAS